MEVIGHRGAAALGPENTLESIRAALDAAADGVEIDVRLSSDGVPVLMHDAGLVRTTRAEGRVDEVGSEALGSLGVPTLEQVLDLVPDELRVIVELKGTPWEPGYDPNEPLARVVAAMLAAIPPRRVTVSSFNPLALAVIRAEASEVATGVLTAPGFDLRSNLAAAVEGGHDECHVPIRILEASFLDDAHAAGRSVVAWTVNDAGDLRRCRDWRVDAVVTDDPRAALEALEG
jgi:glycerophosphoryl diester phosphodiesterase